MGRFLLQVLAAFVGGIFLLLFLLLLGIGIGAAFSKTEPIAVEKGSYLKLDLGSSALADRSSDDAFSDFEALFSESERLGLNKILSAIERAENDPSIAGIYLPLGGISGGMASVREIRQALLEFKKNSGKPIIAYGTFASTKSLYLASSADSVFLNPHGAVEWSGLSIDVAYLKDGLDKLGVKVDLVRGSNNRFKSAGEPLIQNRMSEANRAQLQALAGDLWSEMLGSIAESRGIEIAELQRLADSLSVGEAASVLEHKLVDGLLEEDQFDLKLARKTTGDSKKDAQLISVKSYLKSPMPEGVAKPGVKADKIAILYAEGEFNEGDGMYEIQSDRMIEAIRSIRKDSKVKAVVLRVNSPGGLAFAADKICRELELLSDSLPLVVSMGDVAASAGYMISAMGDSIYAHPNTITGSIGVFGMLLDGSELLEEKLGIRFEQVKTAAHSGMGSPSRPLDPFERKMLQREIDRYYAHFVERVAKERGMEFAQVDSIGQGRVWSGVRGMQNGLTDRVGGMREAEACAARMASLEKGKYRVVEYPQLEDPFQKIIDKIEGRSSQWKTQLPEGMARWFDMYERALMYDRQALQRLEWEWSL